MADEVEAEVEETMNVEEARAKLKEMGYSTVNIPDGVMGMPVATLLLHPDGEVTWLRRGNQTLGDPQ